MAVVGLRSGHSPNCKGAIGLRDEQRAMRDLYYYVEKALRDRGHTVINCNSNAYTIEEELYEGVSKANNSGVDLFISMHMNSYNGEAHGTEAWVYSQYSRSYPIAQRLVNNYAKLGFYNRGVKTSKGYYELRNLYAPAIILETLFCDSERDINIWSNLSWEQLANAIADAI